MMRKELMVLLAGLLVVAFASVTMAQEKKEGKAGAEPVAKPEAAKAGKAHVSKIERALAGLTLSAEEKAKVDPVVAEYKEKTKTAEIKDQKKLIQEYAEKIAPLLSEENKAKFDAAMKAKGRAKKEKAGEEKKEGGAAK